MATKVKRPRIQLIDLEGVRSGKLLAVGVSSVSAAVEALRRRRAITAAGDNGAINVWLDDNGLWHCEFHRYLRRVNVSQFKYLAAVHTWLKEWWPQMRR